eukprot:CAMPEP_0170556430 /NCGR_PEP_ID=MMETSP0211-20121228/16818_1 /TAXON_ID=311385 /ORGANISM="Pseudokeronopsis sp., Strain OXSARD2" /LENGTH=60 /DNA_ID=CAMNT_0010866759 /DNA_START=369 /DNA_END=551 /DNA_ORIENTATION=+
MINPHFYHPDNKKIDPFQTNGKIEDVPMMFGATVDKSKSKAYNNYTKTFDNNSNKIGLRK